jgi:hypothetical protein
MKHQIPSAKHFLQFFLAGFFVFTLVVIFPEKGNAQLQTTCDNSNLNYGDWSYWAGCYGQIWETNNPTKVHLQPCMQPGFLIPRHRLMHLPATLDPYACDSLLTIFPGETFSARLGDTAQGGHAEQLKYNVTVTNFRQLFIYRYAVVLESPGHVPVAERPGFSVQVNDSLGNVIDSTCGYYTFVVPYQAPSPFYPIPAGWHYCGSPPTGLGEYWKNWTTVGLNLGNWIGQTVTIVFTTHGCAFTAHRGYAYISAYCNYLQVHTAMCEGDTSATLTAPPGFGYHWSTGDTTASITVPHPVTGDAYSCVLTAVNGCQVTITDTLTYTEIHANFTHGSACTNIATQFNDSSYVNQNSVVNWKWNFGDGSPNLLGNPTPTHIFTNAGPYLVKLKAYSTEGCTDSIAKTIVVDSLPTITNTVTHSGICSLAGTNITLTANTTNTFYTWEATCNNPSITGYSDAVTPTGNVINQTLNNTSIIIDSVKYAVHPLKGMCQGPEKDFYVRVYPVPDLTSGTLPQFHCDSTLANLWLSGTYDSVRFTWTCTTNPGANLTGYSDYTTLPGVLTINQLIRNTGYNVDTLTYHITGHAFGCSGPTHTWKVVVYPKPDLSNTPLAKTICHQGFTNINLTSHVANTLFTWTCTASGPGITGWSANYPIRPVCPER